MNAQNPHHNRGRRIPGEAWSSRSLGSRFQHNVFYWLLRCRLMFLARGLLTVVVFYYTMLPHVRQRCQAYLQKRFGICGPLESFVHAYRLYLNFGHVLLERMAASVTSRLPLVKTSTIRDILSCTLQKGKGCIVVSAHVGAWQLGLGALGSAGVPVHILQWRDPGDVDNHYFERGQGRPVNIIDAAQPVEALVQVTAALRQGHVVALMGDRRMISITGVEEPAVETDFLNGRILLPIKAYALASTTGAPLLMIFTARVQKSGSSIMHAQEVISPVVGEEIIVAPGLNHRDPRLFAPYAQQFARGLENFVEKHPYQFYNFYNMWLENHGHTEYPHKS